jgi:hypothetical protein
MEISMFLPTAAGQVYLIFYWLAAGIWAFPSSSLISFNYPEAFQ